MRHNAVRNRVGRFASAARLGPVLEKPGLLPSTVDHPQYSDGRRPADVYLPMWEAGEPPALDFAVASPQRQDIVSESSEDGSAAVTRYQRVKRTHLDTEAACKAQGVHFIPMIASPAGGWGSDARKVFQALAQATAVLTGEPAARVAQRQRQSLCVLLRKANARAVVARDAGEEGRDVAERTSALEVLAATAIQGIAA